MPPGVYKHHPHQGFQKGDNRWKGKHLSEEHKKKLSDLKKGKPVSEATKKGMYEAIKRGEWGKWNIGKPKSEEMKQKIRETLKRKGIKPTVHWEASGEEHPNWKGKDVGYNALHSWIRRTLGLPKKCEFCGTDGKKVYHWSNKNHKYLRKIDNWQSLCVSCHRKYDYAKFGVVGKGNKRSKQYKDIY